MRIAHLTLANWKNFTRADLSVQERLVIVGPNAGGKSNFLDAFRFLHDLVMPGKGLAQAVCARGGIGSLLPYSLNPEDAQQAEIEISVRLKESAHAYWDYTVAFKAMSLEDTTPVITREIAIKSVGRMSELLLGRPTVADIEDPERLTQTALEQVGLNGSFRPIARFFRSIRGTHLSTDERNRVAVQSSGYFSNVAQRPIVAQLLASMIRTPEHEREERLKKLTDALRLLIPDLKKIEWHPSATRRTCLRLYRSSWSSRSYADETRLSEGLLRLFSFFWAMQEKDSVLILEEPETALPPGVLQVLIPYAHEAQKANGCCQIIVSTHSPALLSDPGIAAEEVAIIRPSASQEGEVTIALASSDPALAEIMQVGISAAEAVFPIVDDPAIGLELLCKRL